MNKRITWIDFGKGITILLVVIGHVALGLFESSRFYGNEKQLLLLLTELVYVLHIPVFFALSGFFFKKYNNFKEYLFNMRKKTLSLGVPYVVFSIVMFGMKKLGGGSVRNSVSLMDVVNIYKTPIDHLWYLYTLFSIFLILGLLSILIKNDKFMFIILVIGFILANIFPTDIFFLQRFLIWAPVFYFGKILGEIKIDKRIFIPAVLFYLIYILIWIFTNFSERINYSQPSWWGLIIPVSIILSFVFFQSVKENKVYDYFVKIGKFSLPIYLIHAPVASVVRIFLFKFGVNNLLVHLLIGILVAWFLTILLFTIAKNIKVIDFIFYPTKYLFQKK